MASPQEFEFCGICQDICHHLDFYDEGGNQNCMEQCFQAPECTSDRCETCKETFGHSDIPRALCKIAEFNSGQMEIKMANILESHGLNMKFESFQRLRSTLLEVLS